VARRVFFSFYFAADAWRTSQVRSIGAIEGNKAVSDNDWEAVKKGGDKAIENWIDGQLSGKSCAVVLVGAATAGRKWIDYEIVKSWNGSKGVVGIRIHNLKDAGGKTSSMGKNPFDGITLKNGTEKMANVVTLYNPPGSTSKEVYDNIANNIESLVEKAIMIRDNYI
jgi:MTH538 TIR-like domain (DUF1863)